MDNWYKTGLDCILALIFAATFSVLPGCDSESGKSPQEKSVNTLEIVSIGRLICGGHLPLAVVEKKYQDQLKTFKLYTVQNHDWNDVVTDMKSGKLAGTFILSPLAMNLIHNGFPGKIVLMPDRNGNGFVLSKKIKSIGALKNSYDELTHQIRSLLSGLEAAAN